MSSLEAQFEYSPLRDSILTLEEAAEYLRVEPDELEQFIHQQSLPARKIGGEWRISRKALEDWMKIPDRYLHDHWRHFPLHFMDPHFAEEVLQVLHGLKHRLQQLEQSQSTTPKPGTKQAVLQAMGIFAEDGDIEERLAETRAFREESS